MKVYIFATILVLVTVIWYFHDTPWNRCQKLVGWNYGFNKKVTVACAGLETIFTENLDT